MACRPAPLALQSHNRHKKNGDRHRPSIEISLVGMGWPEPVPIFSQTVSVRRALPASARRRGRPCNRCRRPALAVGPTEKDRKRCQDPLSISVKGPDAVLTPFPAPFPAEVAAPVGRSASFDVPSNRPVNSDRQPAGWLRNTGWSCRPRINPAHASPSRTQPSHRPDCERRKRRRPVR